MEVAFLPFLTLLSFLFFFTFLALFDILLVPDYDFGRLRFTALRNANLIFFFCAALFLFFDFSMFSFSGLAVFDFNFLQNTFFVFALDGVSLWFFLLTAFLLPVCLLVSWQLVRFRHKLYYSLFFLIILFLFFVFSILDLTLFYVFFEFILIPMFVLIGVWGSRERKILAAYKFFFYTFWGSSLMLLFLIYLWFKFGSTSFFVLTLLSFEPYVFLNYSEQHFAFVSLMLAFCVKLPVYPLHLWLPEAHVEASTAGSVLLAGILLKMGGYGIFRFVLPFFVCGFVEEFSIIYVCAILGVFYTSLIALRQIDLKKIIAYSSVAHMAYVLLGLFSFNIVGLEGALFLMLSHGLVSSALFIAIGVLYDRYKTRLLYYFGGLAEIMPLYSGYFLFFILANLGFPGTSAFIGELLVLLSLYKVSPLLSFLASLGVIFAVFYNIWLYNRIFWGQLSLNFIMYFADLNWREFVILTTFTFLTVAIGIFPNIILNFFHLSVLQTLILCALCL